MNKTISLLIIFTFGLFSSNAQDNYQTALAQCSTLDYFKSQACMIDEKIFDFEGTTYSGNKVQFSELKGKLIVINLWFMACAPCMAELEGLNEIVEKYQDDDVAFISFTWDSKEDLEQDFFPNHNFKFEIVSDAQTFLLEEIDHGWGFPTTFIVDQEGYIQKIISGGSTEKDVANKDIKENIIPILDQLLSKE